MAAPALVFGQELGTPLVIANLAALLTEISTLIGATSTWEVKASGADYLEVGPVAGAPAAVLNMRLLLVGGAAPFTLADRTTSSTTVIMANFCPDITGKTGTSANWKTEDPYAGSAYPATGFAQVGPAFASVDEIQLLASAETLLINNRVGNNSSYPMYCGAGILPTTDTSGNGDGDRIFCFQRGGSAIASSTVTGTLSAGSTTLWGRTSSASFNSNQLQVLRPEDDTWDFGAAPFIPYSSWWTGTPSSPGTMWDHKGNLFLVPIPVYLQGAGGKAVGTLRQIYPGFGDALNAQILRNTALEDKGFLLGYSNSSVGETYVFANA